MTSANLPEPTKPWQHPQRFSHTPLIAAVKQADVAEVARLLADGADVDGRDWAGATALICAVWFGDQEICRLLLAAGTNVNTRTRPGRTPLDVACMVEARRPTETSQRIQSLLLAHGAMRNDLEAI